MEGYGPSLKLARPRRHSKGRNLASHNLRNSKLDQNYSSPPRPHPERASHQIWLNPSISLRFCKKLKSTACPILQFRKVFKTKPQGHIENWTFWMCMSNQFIMWQKISEMILSRILRPVRQTLTLLECRRQHLLFSPDYSTASFGWNIYHLPTNVCHDKDARLLGWKDFCHPGLWFATSVLLTLSHYSWLKRPWLFLVC